jgi:apolipoprotein N-acyltransferase
MPRSIRRTTLLAALFGAFGLLLAWPLLSLAFEAGLGAGAAYVLAVWLAMIVASFLVSRASRRPDGAGRGPQEGG